MTSRFKLYIDDFTGMFTLPDCEGFLDGLLMNNPVDSEFDQLIRSYLLVYTPERIDDYEFKLGDLTLWGENYPYAFGTVCTLSDNRPEIKDKFKKKRPSRKTIGILYSLLKNS